MTLLSPSRRTWCDFLSAIEFLTRIPVPAHDFDAESLPRSAVFFPVVGAMVGAGAALLHTLLAPHLARPVAAFIIVIYLVLVTGGLHEDGLADAADGFGGGHSREKILLILRDSRIGSYGGLALVLSVAGRILLLAALPLSQVPVFLVAAAVLSRWTILPLSHCLVPSRASDAAPTGGQGARLAGLTSRTTLVAGTLFSFLVIAILLRARAFPAILTACLLAWSTGAFYRRRLGGITGDCFGATVQLAELGVYVCGAWSV